MTAPAAERRHVLTRTVEFDVIPMLLRARGLGQPRSIKDLIAAVTPAHVAELVSCTLDGGDGATSDFVAAMRDQGFRAEALYLDLLAPTANRLGEMWVEDACDFTDVTVGLIRLHRAMRMLSPTFLGSGFVGEAERLAGPRALLVPVPGEQHTFGLSMVFDFFRRAGWRVRTDSMPSADALASAVRRTWFDMVGISVSCDERLDTVRSAIRAVRLASRNPGVAVMVGGPPFVLDAALAARVGADGTSRNGLEAVGNAHALLRREHERR